MAPLETFSSQRSSGHLRLIAAIVLGAVLILAGYGLQHTISCFLLSFVIAYLMEPLIVLMESKRFRRVHAITLIYLVMAVITIFCLMFLLPMLTINWSNLLQSLPQYLQKLKLLLADWQSRLPTHYGTEEIRWLTDKLTSNLDSMLNTVSSWFYNFIGGVVFNVFNIILSPILVFFMLYYKWPIIDTLKSWLPPQYRALVMTISHEVNDSIGGYVRGQVLVSIMVALALIPALYLLEIPNPILCALFAGAASVLPFIGVILAMLPALLLAWLKFGTSAILFKVLLVFSVIYFLEGYLVKPLVFKKSMDLNPLLSIIVVMAFGELMGFWGVMLALPLTAAIKIAWEHWLSGDFDQMPPEAP